MSASEPSGWFDWIPALFDKFQAWVVDLLPDFLGQGFSDIGELFGPGLQYLGWVTGLDIVLPLTVGAYITRFLIRRIPIIG